MTGSEAPLLDVRPEAEFLNGHAVGAASIPLEELALRSHELPPAHVPLRVTDADPSRAASAAGSLALGGRSIQVIPFESLILAESGRSNIRLWQPNPFLVESIQRIRLESTGTAGRALDVACGSGRDAAYLAMQGYNMLAVDVLPDALDRAADLARRNGVTITTAVMDIESGPTLPSGSFDLVTVFRFLHRPLWPLLRRAVAPGGFICCETFHEQNRTTGRPPNNPAHLLSAGELAAAFAGFEILICRDAVERDGRFFSSLLARRCQQ